MKSYDYSKLLDRMREKGMTQNELATMIPLNPSTLNIKLNNEGDFTQQEMLSICNILSIPIGEITIYFFYPNTFENKSMNIKDNSHKEQMLNK